MISFKNNNNTPKIVSPSASMEAEAKDWIKCPSCRSLLYSKHLKENLQVCPKCSHHFRLNALEWMELLLDDNSFKPFHTDMTALDILEFSDQDSYADRITKATQKASFNEAIQVGTAQIESQPLAFGVMDFQFIGGSMGVVVGEKIVRLAEKAQEEHLPLLIISASGGARMQEGMFSLIQMARTAGAIGRFQKNQGLYLSLLTHPTTGGVSASFAFLGDIILSEPQALIGFAGARVIEQTTRQKLPPRFQTAEFLLEHGQIDKIVERKFMKRVIGRILSFYYEGHHSAMGVK
jgi:acetyl-CoA carboxylase carboxyl transferase subunit beta